MLVLLDLGHAPTWCVPKLGSSSTWFHPIAKTLLFFHVIPSHSQWFFVSKILELHSSKVMHDNN
jgi:hypothetical protein